MLLAPLAAELAATAKAASGRMSLCIHQNTSRAAGYRKSLEGWAKAGIKNVELTDVMLEDFLKTDDLAAARRVVTDQGLTPVSCAAVLPDFWIPNPNRATAMDTWKKRCEQFSSFGITKIYCPVVTSRKVTLDDYKGAADCIREGGEAAMQSKMTAMIEFVRNSSFISTLTTSIKLIRATPASEREADARLLSLLVGPKQIRRPRSDPQRRVGPRAFPGCSGHAARAIG